MGQKVNPNILRLGVTKSWKTEFFEKNNQELSRYIFKDLEIKKYLERFLEVHGIILQDYRQHFNNSTLNCYIFYYLTPQFFLKTKNNNRKVQKVILLKKTGEKKIIVKRELQESNLHTKTTEKNIINTKPFLYYSNKLYINKVNNYLRSNNYESLLKSTKIENFTNTYNLHDKQIDIKGVFEHVFKVVNLFSNNQYNLIFNFCCINKQLNFSKITNNKKLIFLRKFRNTTFFKDGIELLFHSVHCKNSSNLLARFIALQIKTIKRQKFFLTFLKKTLTLLLNSNISKVKGIKIMIKGRLNGAPKARHKVLRVGDVPVQTIKTNVDFTQTKTHNVNGSYGIKVWVIEKS